MINTTAVPICAAGSACHKAADRNEPGPMAFSRPSLPPRAPERPRNQDIKYMREPTIPVRLSFICGHFRSYGPDNSIPGRVERHDFNNYPVPKRLTIPHPNDGNPESDNGNELRNLVMGPMYGGLSKAPLRLMPWNCQICGHEANKISYFPLPIFPSCTTTPNGSTPPGGVPLGIEIYFVPICRIGGECDKRSGEMGTHAIFTRVRDFNPKIIVAGLVQGKDTCNVCNSRVDLRYCKTCHTAQIRCELNGK